MRKILLALVAVLWTGVAVRAHEPETDKSFVHLNKVIDKLERGLLATGLYVSALDPSNALGLVNSNGWQAGEEVYTKPAIDFLLLEQEHEPVDLEKLRTFLLALNSKREVYLKGNLQPNLVTFVVIPFRGDQPLQTSIKQLLDLGVHGVMCTVDNAEQARNLVKVSRYPRPRQSPIAEPRGERVAYPLWATYLWGLTEREYIERADVWPLNPRGELMLMVHIETKEGVENVESIVKVPGIAAVHFGPRDYSFSIDHPMEMSHPEVLAGLQRVKDACDRQGIQFIDWADETNIQRFLDEGRKMLIIGTDTDNGFADPQKWGNRGAGKVIDFLRKGNQ